MRKIKTVRAQDRAFFCRRALRRGFGTATKLWSSGRWRDIIVVTMQTKTKPVELLGRMLAPLGRCLTTASAKETLSLRAGAPARRRLERLAAKCDAGALTPEEQAEYLLYVEVGDLVALLQAKARRHLAGPGAN